MLLSFIIIAKNKEFIKIDLIKLQEILLEKKINAEIILALGVNPSGQRNKGALDASGEWLYFLDDDSILDEYSLDQFLITIKKFKQANVVGGPSVLPNPSSKWQQAVQFVFSSDFGVGPLKSRYFSNGQMRESNEKEMILCNLLIKRDIFNSLNGFNENIYPNEENEFLSRIHNVGNIIYSPLMIVYRQHRENALEFLQQMTSYGKGRTRHLLFSNEYTDYIYFLPLLVLVFALGTIFINALKGLLLVLAAIYFFIIIFQSLFLSLKNKDVNLFYLSILAFVVCHLGYAVGLFVGFFDQKNRISGEIKIQKLFNSTQAF